MPKPRSVMVGLDGRRIPLGTRVVLVDEHFIGKTALPATLVQSSGTASFVAPDATTHGYLKMMTAATLDATAILSTAASFPVGAYRSLSIELDGFRLDASNPPVEIAILMSGSAGVGAYTREAIPTGSDAPVIEILANAVASGYGTKVYDTWRANAEGQMRRNVRFMVSSPLKEAVLFEQDVTLGFRDCSVGSFDGTITPKVQVRTKEAVAHGFYLTALRIIGEV